MVSEDRLEAVAVMVGETQLRAGVGALAADDHARPGRPAVQLQQIGDLADLPVGPWAAVLVQRAHPVLIGDLEDRFADGVGGVVADRVADPALPAPAQQLMGGAGAVDAQQEVDVLDVLGGDLRQRLLGDRDLVGGGVRAGVARSQLAGQRLAGLIAIGQHAQSRP